MRKLWPLAVTVLVLAGAVAWSAAQPPGETGPAAKHRPAITIKGHVDGLYPGSAGRIGLRLRNRSRGDLVVRRVGTRVGAGSAACPAEYLRVAPRRLRLLVPAGSVRRAKVRARMPATSPDACQGARFPLRYRARVKRR